MTSSSCVTAETQLIEKYQAIQIALVERAQLQTKGGLCSDLVGESPLVICTNSEQLTELAQWGQRIIDKASRMSGKRSGQMPDTGIQNIKKLASGLITAVSKCAKYPTNSTNEILLELPSRLEKPINKARQQLLMMIGMQPSKHNSMSIALKTMPVLYTAEIDNILNWYTWGVSTKAVIASNHIPRGIDRREKLIDALELVSKITAESIRNYSIV